MYRALIVCNSRFPESDGKLIDLHGPKKDGFLLRDVLTDHATGMFDKSEVRNLNEGESHEVSVAIEEFFSSAEPDDTLLFYYSGHGQTRNQQLFLCTQDTSTDRLYSTGIPGVILNDLVESSLAEAKILILDCCYGAMFKGDEITEELSGTGRYVLAATSATQRASDGLLKGLPSPFTKALADGLLSKAVDRNGDGQVDLDDVYDYLGTIRFDGYRPHRNFDGEGRVPVALRENRPARGGDGGAPPASAPVPAGFAPGLSPAEDSAIYALESAQPDLAYLDRTVARARYSLTRVEAFRAQMRSDLLENMPARLSATDFLQKAGLMRHERLTYAGLLLFGENPAAFLPAAVVQCVRFHGTTMTAPLESTDLQGTVPELIVEARDFVARVARIGDMPTADGAYAQAAYRYPMIAVREIIANAVVHRDYADQESCVQIYAFDDRIEISSPGQWGGAPVTVSGERPLGQLERRSQRRNFRLAQTLTWSKLVEGVGAGVVRSITDCESVGAPEPVVVMDERTVKITIFPAPPQETPEIFPSESRDSRNPTRAPIYQQIAEDLRRQIESGDIGRGTMLPTEIELRDQYNASRNTIRDAVKRLISLGLVESRPGQGTFVTRPIDPFVTTLTADPRSGFGGGEGAMYLREVHEAHRTPRATTPKVEVRLPPEPVRSRLRVQADATVVVRHQERYIDDLPWSLQTSFYPMGFVTDGATGLLIASDIPEGTVAYLAEHGHRQVSYRDWITTRRATEEEQRFFGVGYESTVFEIFRTGYDQHGAPMRVTVSVFPADRNQFVYDVGDTPGPEYG